MASKRDLQRLGVSAKIPLAAIQKAKHFEVLTRPSESTHEDILPFTPIIGLLGPLESQASPTTPEDTAAKSEARQSLVYCSLSGGHQVRISELFPVSDCLCQYCLACLRACGSVSACPVCQRCFSASELAHL